MPIFRSFLMGLVGALAFMVPAIAQTIEKLPKDVTPLAYILDLDVNPKLERFSGTVSIAVRLDKATRLIKLHGRGLNVRKAVVDRGEGTPIAATYAEKGETGHASLTLSEKVGPGYVSLVMDYDAPFNTTLVGLNKVVNTAKGAGESYAYTQFEAIYARRAFPSFDEPRFKTPFTTSITVHGDDKAASNGPEVRTTNLGDGRRRIDFAPTQPIPTYLVALAVGPFDIVEWEDIPPNAVRKRPLRLRGIAPKGKGGQFAHALKSTAAMVEILETYFATPYPYAKLDLLAAERSNSAGMENVGLILYRQGRILMGDRPSTRQLRGFASLHAHELAHMWFGNLVTPAWWDDLWLNEAFATWMAAKVIHQWRPETFDDRQGTRSAGWAKWKDRLTTTKQIRKPISTAGDIAGAFDSIVYSKGGSVLSMIEQFLGPVAFRDGLRRFMKRHAHGVATSEDFFAALAERASTPGVLAAFRSFVDQPGTPRVEVDWQCDASGAATVQLKQSRAFPLGSSGDARKSWSIPLCLVSDDGTERSSQCLLLDKPDQTVKLERTTCPRTILPNRNGAAYLNFSLPERGWKALIDRFDVLPAAEALATLSSIREAYSAGLISTELAVAAATAAARSPHWDVVSEPMHLLRNIKTTVLPEDTRAAAEKRFHAIYSPAKANFDLSAHGLSKTETSNARSILRKDLVWFLALDAGDRELSQRLSQLGQAYVGYGGDGKRNRDVIDPDLVQAALSAAAVDVGVPFVDHLVTHMRSTNDPTFHAHIIHAIGYPTDGEVVMRILDLTLEAKTRDSDASWLLARLGQQPANRERVFTWLNANWDAVVRKFPKHHMPWVPWRVKGFCSARDKSRAQKFFAERMKPHKGGSQQLTFMLEGIEICEAVVTAQRAAAVRYFQK